MRTTSLFSLRQPAALAARRQQGARTSDPKTPPPAGAPQPIDAEWLKFVGGGATGAPVDRW